MRGSQQPCCDRNARNHPAAQCVPRQRPPPFQKPGPIGIRQNSTRDWSKAVVLTIRAAILATPAQCGNEKEAKAILEKAVAALKENKEKALEMFNKGEGGFKDRDLYVFCANASDGILTAHPHLKGEQLQDIVGKKGFPLGQEIMRTATEGQIKEVT